MREILITSSVLIVVIVLLRTLLKGKMSLRLQYALWLLVALRLLVPVSFFSSSVSVMNAVETVEQITHTIDAPAIPQTPEGQLPAGETAPKAPEVSVTPAAPAPSAAPKATVNVEAVAGGIWLAGIGGMSIWFLVSDMIFRRKLRRCAKRMEGLDCPLPVYVTAAVLSPCLYGLFRPAVYLTPDCLVSGAEIRHVLAHEVTHYRHRDPLWSLIRCLCLTIYWFDPLVWLAAGLSRRDCELACDEGAIRTLGEAERLSYGRTLLSMVVPRSAPVDLLRTATTMSSGKNGLKERIALIAKRPRAAAVTVVAVVLVAAVAVGCTFTGAKERKTPDLPLEEALTTLPDDLKGSVVLKEDGEAWGGKLLTAYYYQEDMGADYGGWMCSVAQLTQVEFEQSYNGFDTTGGASYLGRDVEWYYVLFSPTDVRTAHYETYGPAQKTLRSWVEETFTEYEEIKPMEDDPVYQALSGPYSYDSPHINVTYHPYYGLTNYGAERTDTEYTLLLSQPAKQGEGGIWCVDRWYDGNGTAYMWLPETDMTLAEYYADLQAKADAGEADWALDPLELCMKYVKDNFDHDRPAEAFTVGDVYEGEPQIVAAQPTINEGVQKRLEGLMGGENGTVVLSLETHSGGEVDIKNISAPSQETNGPYIVGRAAIDYIWSDESEPAYFNGGSLEPPQYAWAVIVYSEDMSRYFKFFEGSSVALYHDEASGDNWYEAVPNETDVPVANFIRGWFDEKEYEAAVDAATAAGTDFEQVAWNWMESLAAGMRALSPGNQYELLDVQPYSGEVYDTIPGDDTQFCFYMTLAFQLEHPERSLFNAGAGLSPIESGPYKGYQSWGMEVVMRRDGETWHKLDWGSGGYQLEDYR